MSEERRSWLRWVGGVFGLLPLLATGVLGASYLFGSVADAGPGTMPDWVAAFSTLAAFLAAVLAADYARRALVREEDRDERWLLEREREQARLVAVWPTLNFDFWRDDDPHGSRDWAYLTGMELALANGSRTPVTQVMIRVAVESNGDWPHDRVRFTLKHEQPQLLPNEKPGHEMLALSESIRVPNDPSPEQLARSWNCSVELTFTDSSGTVWRRSSPIGDLVKVETRD